MKPQYFLLTIAAVILYFLSDLFEPFLKAILVAILLVVATNNFHTLIFSKVKNRFISSFFMTLFLGAVFFIPLLYFIFSFVNYTNQIDQQTLVGIYDYTLNSVKDLPSDYDFIKSYLQQFLEQINIALIFDKTISLGALIGKNSAKFMIDIFFILTFYFFMNLYSKEFISFIIGLVPLSNEDKYVLFFESSSV